VSDEDQSVLAIPVPQADGILSHVRSSFSGEVPPAGSPAHITLLYPWMPPASIDDNVLAELSSLFAAFPAFDFILKQGWFGREVLLLVPADARPFVSLTEAIVHRWPEYPYYGGEYDEIEPHISLAYGDEAGLSGLAAEVTHQLPVQVHAPFVDLSTGEPGHMVTRAKFPLNATSH
jgi:hypothetical protein